MGDFLDLDGTIYLGGEPIEGALDFLERLDERGMKVLLSIIPASLCLSISKADLNGNSGK